MSTANFTVTASQQNPVDLESRSTRLSDLEPDMPDEAPPIRAGLMSRFYDRLDDRISRLSVKNNFWHRVCSWIWLPLAFRSGIKIHKGSASTFSVVLPFRRFNRNWYSAMAGAALLGNAEVAGGMYVFGKSGGDYTVVCKALEYKFLRPCVGPAVYRIEPRQAIEPMLKSGTEFNIVVDMNIVQMVQAKHERERRVGTCTATFHVTPKSAIRRLRLRRLQRRLSVDR